MRGMFSGAEHFNQPLGPWKVGAVRDMSFMFSGASAFNQALNEWDVSNVLTMESMFGKASAFNQEVSKWNVVRVRTMAGMFREADAFNQSLAEWGEKIGLVDPGPQYAHRWDVRATGMFFDARSFSQSLVAWDAWMLKQHRRNPNVFFGMLQGAVSFVPAEQLTENQRNIMHKSYGYGYGINQ
eukprot:GSA120T00022064001.1